MVVKRIGRYELGKTLGCGNFSKVKVARDVETGEEWAIKIVDKEQLARERMEEQQRREIAVMKMLRQPNVVALREVMETPRHIYLVVELASGGELFDRIAKSKRFDESTARHYFHQLIAGVHYCHMKGIAHRDLKPENLLLDANDTLKISDFGLSNIYQGQDCGQKAMLQTVCGTPNYVAPEVLKECGYNGVIADIWSCGVVLFVMLAGYLPFDDEDVDALFRKIERGEFRMGRHFSADVCDLISRMLCVEPSKRATVEEIVQHPWFLVDWDPAMLTSGADVGVTEEHVRDAVHQINEQQ